jgi:prepilin-type N-terminal cleavage/methylation domain-containing protein
MASKGEFVMSRTKKGFSLIELLVALTILAAVALRSVSNINSQARYQQTTRSLDEIRSAIVGTRNLRGPDGSALVTGFVADIGRLPKATIDPLDPLGLNGDPFSELLKPNGIPNFAQVAAGSDPSILIGVGWQGPYIRLAAGPSFIRDGWGHSLQYVPKPFGTDSTLKSLGSDGIVDGPTDGYKKDVAVTTPGGGLDSPFANFYGQVKKLDSSGNLTTLVNLPAGTSLYVCYFGPKDDGTVVEVAVKVMDSTAPIPKSQFNLSDAGVTIGSRVLRAYVLDDAISGGTFSNVQLALKKNAAGVVIQSPPLNVTGIGGAQKVADLILPDYP